MKDSEFEFIRTLVYDHSRIQLGPDKSVSSSPLASASACAPPNITSISEYCRLLKEGTVARR